MERENKRLKILLATLSVFAMGLCGYFAYTVYKLGYINDSKCVKEESSNIECEEVYYDLKTIDADKLIEKIDYASKNYDGSYGIIKEYTVDHSDITSDDIEYIKILLEADGKVRVKSTDSSGNSYSEYLNVVGTAVDLVEFNIPGISNEQLFYILNSEGNVYYYKIGNAIDGNYNVVKEESVSNIVKLFVYSWGPKQNAGGSWALFAMDKDNNYTMLKSESV